jgi:hypothetical protein
MPPQTTNVAGGLRRLLLELGFTASIRLCRVFATWTASLAACYRTLAHAEASPLLIVSAQLCVLCLWAPFRALSCAFYFPAVRLGRLLEPAPG